MCKLPALKERKIPTSLLEKNVSAYLDKEILENSLYAIQIS